MTKNTISLGEIANRILLERRIMLMLENAAGYKKNVDLEMLDPTGVVVEKWILEGTMITKTAWSEVNYGTDTLATLDATLQMDRCILVY